MLLAPEPPQPAEDPNRTYGTSLGFICIYTPPDLREPKALSQLEYSFLSLIPSSLETYYPLIQYLILTPNLGEIF